MHPKIVDLKLTIIDVDDVQQFDGYLNVQRQLAEPFVHVTILIDSGNNNFDMVYFNKTVSVCRFLEKDKINPLVGLFHGLLSRYYELPKRCPILKVGRSYDSIRYALVTHNFHMLRYWTFCTKNA